MAGKSGSFWLGVGIGFVVMVLLNSLPVLGPLIGGFIAGIIAVEEVKVQKPVSWQDFRGSDHIDYPSYWEALLVFRVQHRLAFHLLSLCCPVLRVNRSYCVLLRRTVNSTRQRTLRQLRLTSPFS